MSQGNPIDTVLAAEKDAEAEIEAKRLDAHRTVNAALAKAREISDRTDARILKIHSHCADDVKAKCDAMWRDYENEPQPLLDQALTPANLGQVLASVAAKLTGAPPEKTGGGDD